MITTAVDWLPEGALDDPRLRKSIEEVAFLWGERWLGNAKAYAVSTAKPARATNGLRIGNTSWRESEMAVSYAWNDELGLALALAIVDAPDRKLPRSAQDKALLLDLAWDALCDLAKSVGTALRIDRSIGQPDDRPIGADMEWQMRASRKPLPDFRFAVPKQLIASARKALIGSALVDIEESGSIAAACGEAQIDVEAVIGKASINWGDLEHLEEGDVLVLDSETARPFPLRTTRSGSEICHLKLAQEDSKFKLLMDDGR